MLAAAKRRVGERIIYLSKASNRNIKLLKNEKKSTP